MGGKDASKQFWKYHNDSILKKYQKNLMIGSLNTKQPAEQEASADVPAEEVEDFSDIPDRPNADDFVPLDMYGDLVPYADPNWYQSVSFLVL
jgi:hypothetical protein